MNKEFLISTIIPVYNAEKYLKQTVESIINQSIGFEKNIQLIFVNDGSIDNSEKICKEYKEKYPDNVVYISQKNKGVSAARNEGLKVANGQYINFIDSDDYLDLNCYKKAYNMLEKNDDIDLVVFRLKFFEYKTSFHYLDYKFTSDRIIDIMQEPEGIVLHITTALIRKDVFKSIRFDETLKISEDTKVLYQIILQKEKYGVIKSCIYHYRRRKEQSSAIQNSKTSRDWYINTIKNCHDYLIDLSIKKYGKVIQYVQYFIMYDLQWRIRTDIVADLSEEEKNDYVNTIRKYLKLIDDEVILAQIKMNDNYKMIALNVKYEDDIKKYITQKEDGIYFKDILFIPYDNIRNDVELSHIEKNKLIIEGNLVTYNLPIYYLVNGEQYTKIETFSRGNIKSIFKNKYNLQKSGYYLEIPLDGVKSINLVIKIGNKYHDLNSKYIHFSKIKYRQGYYYDNHYLLTRKNMTIKVKRNPLITTVIYREIRFLAYLIIKKRLYKQAFQRIIYWITKPFMSKNIWLFADREFMARDSGELMFKYTNSQKTDKKRNTYFVIDKHYEDYERMKQYGNVISYHTMKYRLFFLNAKYIISSHADGYVNNAFGKSRKYYADLFRFDYIYLTHGILLHDSSSWLNRINKNISLNVVTSPLEYNSILDGNYYFKPEQLIKTGLPRHDNLIKKDIEEENKILIMASWRSSLVGPEIPGTQRRAYNPKFKKSEYYNFYNDLFNNKRLLETLKKYNYKIKFCIHPSFRGQYKDFKGNEFIEIAIDVDSQYETKSSKMLITDYSSAACDFAYLRKPVVYANFDLDHIYQIHYYNKGYFDYDVNGFGPNCKTLDETIDEIIKCIENNFVMEDKYKKRCEDFFFYHDDNNCKRVYDAIINYDKNK